MKTSEEIKRALECCAPDEELDDGCIHCPYRHDRTCIPDSSTDALAYIRQLEAERDATAKIIYDAITYLEELGSPGYALMQLKKKWNAPPKFEYIEQLENQHADDDRMIDRLFAEKEAIQRDFGDFAARINAGEDVMACEYCKKNFGEGECSCNCLKDFEWRGSKSVT